MFIFKNNSQTHESKIRKEEWIGVDLDGTLAEYNGWISIYHIGDPIPVMVARIKYWIDQGCRVKIFTARVTEYPGQEQRLASVRKTIEEWCEKHIGHRLEITNVKDFGMIELWDDRAVRVTKNTGQPCCSYIRGEYE